MILIHVQVLRLQYEKEQAQAHATTQTKFNYSWGLIKSPGREEQVEGVRLLQGRLTQAESATGAAAQNEHFTEIYRAEPQRRRECLYYLALGNYKLGNYEDARKYNRECAATTDEMILTRPLQICYYQKSQKTYKHRVWKNY
jgi:fission 1 protein